MTEIRGKWPVLQSQINQFVLIKALVVTIATITLFSQDLYLIFNDALQNVTTSYVLVVPFLVAYLIYRKRKILMTVAPLRNQDQPKQIRLLSTLAGILLFITAVLLYWSGSYTFTPLEYHILALPLFISSLVLLLFNPQTLRHLAFPIIFLLFLMPPPFEIFAAAGATLSVLGSIASNAIVSAVGIPSVISSSYGTPIISITQANGTTIPFAVDIACSGIYSLTGFLIFIVFIAYICRDKPWKKLALIAIGIPLILFMNIIRITSILMIGYSFGEQLALQAFHLLGGWLLIFLGTLLLFLISEKALNVQMFKSKTLGISNSSLSHQTINNPAGGSDGTVNHEDSIISKVDIAKVAAIGLSVVLLMSIQTPVFAMTESPANVVTTSPSGQQVSAEILPKIEGYTLEFWARDTTFEDTSRVEMAIAFVYTPEDDSLNQIWVALEIAPEFSALHSWEYCLITYPLQQNGNPATKIEEYSQETTLLANPLILGKYFVFEEDNMLQAVLWWKIEALFAFNSTSQKKYVKISLIAYPENLEQLPPIQNQQLAIAGPIVDYWQPIITWSEVTIITTQYGSQLAGATSLLLAATVVLYFRENTKYKKANRNAYQKLSSENRQIIDSIKQTEKKLPPTLENIKETHNQTTGSQSSTEQLLKKLTELEQTGIIKRQIISQQDEPLQVWKTQM